MPLASDIRKANKRGEKLYDFRRIVIFDTQEI